MSKGKEIHLGAGQKKYLTWGNKLGYGVGELGIDLASGLISSFILLYCTDAIGMNSAIVGTLILLAKAADAFSDIIFGHILDKSPCRKMGKARPYVFWGYFGVAISTVLLFSIPTGWGDVAQYVYFFIWYMLLWSVFYTAVYLAYSALTSLITRNSSERMQVSVIRTISMTAVITITAYFSVSLSQTFGGGAVGWQRVALLYVGIGLVINTISVFSVRELPDEELVLIENLSENIAGENEKRDKEVQKVSMRETFQLLFGNKFYVALLSWNICNAIVTLIGGGIGAYYFQYVFNAPALLGIMSLAGTVPMLLGLPFAPILLKKFGSMRQMNVVFYTLSTIARIVMFYAGVTVNFKLLLIMAVISGFLGAPASATITPFTAAVADNVFKKSRKNITGSVYSCTSLGTKIGQGLGSALPGWLLAAGGYINGAAVQPDSAITIMQVMYVGMPVVGSIIMLIISYFLKVEEDNMRLDTENNK